MKTKMDNRLHNTLLNNYAYPPTWEQLVLAAGELSDNQLSRLPNLGRKSLRHLRKQEGAILERRLKAWRDKSE